MAFDINNIYAKHHAGFMHIFDIHLKMTNLFIYW